jgi:GNAT superfamily N-acetyltransferase
VQIDRVERAGDLRRFIELPYRLYRNHRYWVPPLRSDEQVRLSRKNPFFDHAEAVYFLARQGDEDVGRIAASIDETYNSFQGERQGAFGFFEARSAEAAAGLLRVAEQWTREKGAEIFRGPFSFTSNDECGLLIEGFDRRPVLMMPYNPPDYVPWVEAAGLVKAKDLYSFRLTVPDDPTPEYVRIASITRRREKVKTRPLEMRRFAEDLERVKEIYNSAWERNWGFVPMSDREIDHMAAQLKPAVVPELVRFAEVDGECVGFALLLPDINIALSKVGGRLFPFGLPRLLWELPRIREFRFMALGIRPEWRRKGVAPLLVEELTRITKRKGYRSCEIGWTLEDNDAVNHLAVAMGGVRASVYRIYERRISP